MLCVVRSVHPEDVAMPFSLAAVSTKKLEGCCRDYSIVEAARAELAQRCSVASPSCGPAKAGGRS